MCASAMLAVGLAVMQAAAAQTEVAILPIDSTYCHNLSVDISGPFAAVGWGSDDSVSLFDQSLGWARTQTIAGGTDANFGCAIAIEGDDLIVGASHHPGNGWYYGIARAYRRVGDHWASVGTLAPDQNSSELFFGRSLSIEGDRVCVGGQKDRVYIFEKVNGTWTRVARINDPDPMQYRRFGVAVDLDGDRLMVGAYTAAGPLDRNNAAYIFRLHEGVWTKEAILQGPKPEEYDTFGLSVALRGRTAVVGAPVTDDGSGSVYIFEEGRQGWSPPVTFEGWEGDFFGWMCDLDDQRLVVGARDQGNFYYENGGQVYIFVREEDGWAQAAYFRGSGVRSNSQFGYSLQLDKGRLIVGAPGWHHDPLEGAGFVYTALPGRCLADCNADEAVDLGDLTCFVGLFEAGDISADCSGDAILDLFDFLCFVNAFNGGC